MNVLMRLISPKTRYIVLPANEDGIILRSFVLTQYRRVTDRQKLIQRAALRRALKTNIIQIELEPQNDIALCNFSHFDQISVNYVSQAQ